MKRKINADRLMFIIFTLLVLFLIGKCIVNYRTAREEIVYAKAEVNGKEIDTSRGEHVVTVTRYNPVESQCDSDPLVTADNSKIDLEKLNSGDLRWVAVSRDLRDKFEYGDVIRIISTDTSISGEYEVHDTMHPRFKNCVDILTTGGQPLGLGKWRNVSIQLVRRGRV
jgi:hypothetical protein